MKEISKLSIKERSEWKNEIAAKRTTIYKDYDLNRPLEGLSGLSITEDW